MTKPPKDMPDGLLSAEERAQRRAETGVPEPANGDAPGKAMELRKGVGQVVRVPIDHPVIERIMSGEIGLAEDTPELTRRRILAQLLAAESVEQLLEYVSPVPVAELLGVPLRIESFDFQQSTYEGGLDNYAAARATRLDTGEMIVVSTSSEQVVMAWLVAYWREWLPIEGKVIQLQAKSGNKVNKFINSATRVTPYGERIDTPKSAG